MRTRALIALALIALLAVPIARSPRLWRATAIVQRGPLADRMVLRAEVVASDAARSEVRVELEERHVARVRSGFDVTLTTPGGRSVVGQGVLARIAARAAWITWRGTAPSVTLGQQLEAEIALPPKPSATRVPRSAVVVRNGRTVIETPFLLWSREVPVEVGAADHALAEIRGVSPGILVFLH